MPGLPQWLVVARREFLERVRTVWFVIVTILGPIGMAAIIVVPAWLAVRGAQEEVKIQVVDRTGQHLDLAIATAINDLRSNLVIEPVAPDADLETLRKRIRDDDIDGFLVLPADTLHGGTVEYRGVNATSAIVVQGIARLVDYAVRVKKLEGKLAPAEIMAVLTPIEFDAKQDMGTAQAASGQASFFVGFATMMILYMAILLYAVNVLRSVILEKQSRVVEIMVSSVKPRALMLGKVVGVGSVGLFQLAMWAVMALLMLRYRGTVLGWFGIEGAGAYELPSVNAASLALVLAYFLLGYFFYASLYAAIGAMVNSEQEAQQAQAPVMVLLVIPIACVQLIGNDPRGGAAQVLTMLPFSSPVLMPMRYMLGGAGTGQVALSLAILVATTAATVLLAGRIYRTGILMYGKRPSLRELARWITHR
ncbi:MAG TPA: ABC transporter permease [Kofleriaceae bacterium]|jgi:ABC-2 type transport system permease protein|nr:ABC transporter permease [Kofleriaceae bacterium]